MSIANELLSNQSVYPAEASTNTQYMDASVAHLISHPNQSNISNFDLNDSLINESLILSLTQNNQTSHNSTMLGHLYDALVDLAEPKETEKIDLDSMLSQRQADRSIESEDIEIDDEIEREAADLEQTLLEDGLMAEIVSIFRFHISNLDSSSLFYFFANQVDFFCRMLRRMFRQ